MSPAISSVNHSSVSAVKNKAAIVGNRASKSHPMKSGTFFLDGSGISVRKGDDLNILAKKINHSSKHLSASVKEQKGKFRLIIKTKKSTMRIADPEGVLKKLKADGLMGTKKDSLIQIKGSYGNTVRLVFEKALISNAQSDNALSGAVFEILAEKSRLRNDLPYVYKAYMQMPQKKPQLDKQALANQANAVAQQQPNLLALIPPNQQQPAVALGGQNALNRALNILNGLNIPAPAQQVAANNLPANGGNIPAPAQQQNGPVHFVPVNNHAVQQNNGWWGSVLGAKNKVINAIHSQFVVNVSLENAFNGM